MLRKKNADEMAALGFIEDEDGTLRIEDEDIVIPPPPVATLSHDVPDKRFVITQLKIRDFKSYAGEVVLRKFDKNFTAVVGPNGSGKSNVIDSLLFVFGYRAKKIRSKKVSHLIHKSDQLSDLKSCSVTVHFAMIREEGDSYKIIPDTEFVLSRTANYDDTSYYEMNNRRTQYKEVAQALRGHGIDLEHSRFLILQGEIEAISLMQSKASNGNEYGMLEYVEDIIGSNRYIEPIQKLHKKVAELDVERTEKLNILKIVEKEKDELEKPKNEAIHYLELQNKLTLKENSILHYKRYTAEKELEKILESKKKFLDNLNKLKAEISEIKTSRKSQEGDLENINRELEHHVNDFEKCKELYKTLERQDAAMSEEIKHLKAKKSKIETTLQSTKTELTKLKKQSEVYANETCELNEIKEKLDSEKTAEEKKLSEVMDSMKNETKVLQEKKDKFEVELIKMKKQVYNLKSEMELLQSELDICTRTDKKERQYLASLISNYEKAEISSREEEMLLKKENEKIVTLKAELKSLMGQISESQPKVTQCNEQLKNIRLKLEEAKNSLSTFKNQSRMLQAFAKEKANGRFTGVYGRLGDLGAIDEKYDVAISTACGPLDNIVTDTVSTAQECIKFLKKNNLGYASFIPLEKMMGWMRHAHSKIATPENVPRLFDLIHVNDEDLLPAFYFALKNTLVAENLEQATRIGLQGSDRYRVVTLKGELIDLSGTMSGGGNRVSKGRMGQSIVECTHTPEEVARITEEEAIRERAVLEIRRFVLHLEGQISEKTKQMSHLQLSVKKRQSNYKAYLENAETLKMQIEEQKKKVESSSVDEKQVLDLKEKISKKKKSYEAATKEAFSVEEKVSKIQEEILKITKGSFGKAKKNVDHLTKKVDEVYQSITKSGVNIKTCERNIKKAEEKIKNLEKELQFVVQSKAEIDTGRESTVNQAKEYVTKQEKLQTSIEELKIKRVELKTVFKTIDEKEQKLKLAEINDKNQVKELEADESEKKSFIKSYSAKMAKLKLNEVEKGPTTIPSLSAEAIEKMSLKMMQSESELIMIELESMRPNLSSIAEYKKKEKVCKEKRNNYEVVAGKKELQNKRHDILRARRYSEFMAGFTAIAKKLKETYQMLTFGGDAEMEIVESTDPFTGGIDFSVRPPKKSWKLMRNLSGGEKTLSSLALVFALHYYRPTPFYVMDEIDAALDQKNVSIVAFFLTSRQRNTQFIVVSLRNTMSEVANHLIGIYKTKNCSKNLSLIDASRWKEEDEREEREKEEREKKEREKKEREKDEREKEQQQEST